MVTLNHKQCLLVMLCRPCWPVIKNNKKQVFEIQSASALFSCALLFRPFVFFTFWNKAKEVCDTAVLCTQDFFSM